MRARAVCAGLRGSLLTLSNRQDGAAEKHVEETLQDRSKQHEDKGEGEKATIEYERKIEAERATIAETRDAAAIEDCRAAIKGCRVAIKRCDAAIKRCDTEIKSLQSLRDLKVAERKMAALTLGRPGAATFPPSR